MLKYNEKEDIEARYTQVDEAVENWRVQSKEVSSAWRDEFDSRLRISLIYHDAAMEGEVLTHSEIKAAIDPTIISDTTLIPAYDQIKAFDTACDYAQSLARPRKKHPVKLDTIRELAEKLAWKESISTQYRKDNPLHRLYYHEIASPDKIGYRMRKFSEWLDDKNTAAMHPVERAARMHHGLMRIFPWAKLSGRSARITANLMLAQANYPIAVIHSIDRQRYYEALKTDDDAIVLLYLEAVETTALSATRVYEQAITPQRRHA